ncbi:MAG: hypothetical protein ACR2N3_04175 [Pyrinomonadaceae bacterium]
MKRKVLLAISMLLILGLSIAVFAYTKTNDINAKATACCCKDGSCPMKNKAAKMDGACCDMPDCCCKDGNLCPMKNHEK